MIRSVSHNHFDDSLFPTVLFFFHRSLSHCIRTWARTTTRSAKRLTHLFLGKGETQDRERENAIAKSAI